MGKEMIELTKRLIKFHTTKDNPKELKKCVNFVAKQLPKHLHIKTGVNKDKPYLIATVKKTKNPKLILTGHLDVVEAEHHQFRPIIRMEEYTAEDLLT